MKYLILGLLTGFFLGLGRSLAELLPEPDTAWEHHELNCRQCSMAVTVIASGPVRSECLCSKCNEERNQFIEALWILTQ